MSDVPDGSGPISRRTPRVGDGGAPVSGALAIVLAVVAVVAGFLILSSLSGDADEQADFPDPGGVAGGGGDGAVTSSSVPGGSAVPTLATTTTVPPIVTEGAAVIVANANGVGGTAGSMTRALETGAGFTVVSPTDKSASLSDLDVSVIYYVADNPNAKPVADSLARVLGGVGAVSQMPETPPTSDGTLNDADVLLMLGKDKANKTLAELAPDVNSGGVVTVTNPPVAGDTTPTTTG
ncbi:MAG: LytR C-terminal domain-containing protein [Ilumatobacter sp.]|nr:LytR C-terminal domain-containing protein [Ilumatobacter sp.]